MTFCIDWSEGWGSSMGKAKRRAILSFPWHHRWRPLSYLLHTTSSSALPNHGSMCSWGKLDTMPDRRGWILSLGFNDPLCSFPIFERMPTVHKFYLNKFLPGSTADLIKMAEGLLLKVWGLQKQNASQLLISNIKFLPALIPKEGFISLGWQLMKTVFIH